MKSISLYAWFLLLLFGCQQPDMVLTMEERNKIVEEIELIAKANFDEANENNPGNRSWDNYTDETGAAYNGVIYPDWGRTRMEYDSTHEYYKSVHKFTIDHLKVGPLSASSAYALGAYTHIATDKNGEATTSKEVFTWVFEKQNDQWKIVHFHVSGSCQ